MTQVKLNGMYYDYREDPSMNELQQAHIRGEINLYEPVVTHTEQWKHDNKGDNHHPIEGTRRASTLPPIYIQWKDDHRKRGKLQ
jgi:hypothetical protein